MSKTIEIAMPDDVFLGMRKSPRELASELRLAAAVNGRIIPINEKLKNVFFGQAGQ